MRTIIRKYEIFPLCELSVEAQQFAYNNWLENNDYLYASDNHNTLEQFEVLFDIDVRHWSYDNRTYNYNFFTSLSKEIEELSEVRLATYITNNHWYKLYIPKIYQNKPIRNIKTKKRASKLFYSTDCTLTGYCADCAILQPVYDFLKQPNKNTTYLKLMDECLDGFFRFCRDDIHFRQSKESFRDESQDNGWEYLANGTLFI